MKSALGITLKGRVFALNLLRIVEEVLEHVPFTSSVCTEALMFTGKSSKDCFFCFLGCYSGHNGHFVFPSVG